MKLLDLLADIAEQMSGQDKTVIRERMAFYIQHVEDHPLIHREISDSDAARLKSAAALDPEGFFKGIFSLRL
jgi:hypothetical protein